MSCQTTFCFWICSFSSRCIPLTHLAVNVVIFSKHKPSSDTRSEESVRLELLPLYVLLNCLQTFIREHEAGQVPGVGVSGLSYRSELLSQTVVQVRCKYKRIIKPWTLMHKLHLISIEYYLVRFVISIFQQSCHFDLSKVLYLWLLTVMHRLK